MNQICLKSQIKKENEIILRNKFFKKGEHVIILIKQDKTKSVKKKLDSISLKKSKRKMDSIYSFGKTPVTDSISDGSINHDRYIYGL